MIENSGPPRAVEQVVRRTPLVAIPVLAPESGDLQGCAAPAPGACRRRPRHFAHSLVHWLLSVQFLPRHDASGSEGAAVERHSKSLLFPLVLSVSLGGQRRSKNEDQAPQKDRRPGEPASSGRGWHL